MAQAKFMQDMKLTDLSAAEWEILCNHCGVCCLHKILDSETGDIYVTRVVCEFYDLNGGKCSVYDHRFQFNSACTKLTPDNVSRLSWLPNSCNYRRACEKRPLLKPRPLAAGKPQPLRDNRLAQILGCEVVVYREDMDLADYIILCQSG